MEIIAWFTLWKLDIDDRGTIKDIVAKYEILLIVKTNASDWALWGAWDADLLAVDVCLSAQYLSILTLQ